MSGVRELEEPIFARSFVVLLAVEDVVAEEVDELLDELK